MQGHLGAEGWLVLGCSSWKPPHPTPQPLGSASAASHCQCHRRERSPRNCSSCRVLLNVPSADELSPKASLPCPFRRVSTCALTLALSSGIPSQRVQTDGNLPWRAGPLLTKALEG